MKEIWKKTIGGYYVSNLGNIRHENKKIVKTFLSGRGYKTISVWYGNRNNRKNYVIHRLIAKAFIPNPNNFPQINHKDGNKLNNCVDNLEWVTARENNIHAIKTGLRDYKDREKPVLQIKNGIVIKRYKSIAQANKETKIDKTTIVNCCKHKAHNKSAGGFQWEYEQYYLNL